MQMQRQTHRGPCRFCAEKDLRIDYKDAKALRFYLTERDRILPRRMTSFCAYHQRQLTRAIKKARLLGIISFSASQRDTF